MKFRCSNHKLAVEQGRRNGTPREERLCSQCDIYVLGDELHFVLECPAYQQDRTLIPVNFRKPLSTFNFCRLMSLEIPQKTVLKLAKFVKDSKIV